MGLEGPRTQRAGMHRPQGRRGRGVRCVGAGVATAAAVLSLAVSLPAPMTALNALLEPRRAATAAATAAATSAATSTASTAATTPAASPAPSERIELIEFHHAVDDEALAILFASHRLFIAPCISCTGVATKVVTALRHGIPVVATSAATRGITDLQGSGALAVHDDPDDFAAAASALLTDDVLWARKSEAALVHARTRLSEGVLDARMTELLHTLAQRRCAGGGAHAGLACQFRDAARSRHSTNAP